MAFAWQPLLAGGEQIIASAPQPYVPVAGTTLAALQAGSGAFKYVVAIEGYPYLLTNATPTAAVNAWTVVAGDWSNALEGLYVELDNEQKMHPWEPFQGGGQCTLRIVPDATDRFGIDTHRANAGAESFLTATLGRTGTSIAVKRSDDFTAAPAELYIGSECIGYSAKPNTNTITASQRGKYSPFGSGGADPTHFAEYHRVGIADNTVQLDPVVSQQPRSWIGRWVGVWMHKWDGSNLNAKSDALLVYAGTVAEVRDDPNTLTTSVQLKHVLDSVKDVALGRDLWHGTLAAGYKLQAGQQWTLTDDNNATTNAPKTTNVLTVVASGASGANQINAGRYTCDQIASFITSWLASEFGAGRIYGQYSMTSPDNTSGQPRTRIHYYIAATGSTITYWTLTFPDVGLAQFMGYNSQQVTCLHNDSNTAHGDDSPNAPADQIVWTLGNNFAFSADIVSDAGTMGDQYASLPASCTTGFPVPQPANTKWGAFLFNEKVLIVGQYDDTVSPKQIKNAYLAPNLIVTGGVGPAGYLDNFRVKAGDALPTIRQVFLVDGTFATLMKRFILSTGTAAYNDATYDVLPYNISVGIPAGILGNFKNSCDLLPGALDKLLVVIDKPVKFSDQFGADFLLRRAFMIWLTGGLQLTSWATPSSSAPAIVSLDETTKGEPAGSVSQQRTSTILDSSLIRNVIKLNYNRDITAISGGSVSETYQSQLTLEDPISVDDQSGQGSVMTINCRNVYSESADTGIGIEELAPVFLTTFPIFSRAIRKITRSIDSRYFEGYGPGTIVSVTDKFAREPTTGLRGITARPGMIVRHRWNPGGATVGQPWVPRQMAGEIDIVFMDVNRIVAYAPVARIDETVNSVPFDHGYASSGPTFACKAHEHSEASEPADASRLAVGDVITILDIDPPLGAPTTYWTNRTITGVSGNNISFTPALSSPAWDNTKTYRIVSETYNLAQASQRTKAYQAGTDGTIEQLAPADQYGMITSAILATNFDHTTLPELISTISSQANAGRPRDVAYDRALAFLLDNLMDHKTARQNPFLSNQVTTNTTYSSGNGFQILAMSPLFIGSMLIDGTSLNRYIYAAPFFRSSDGTATTIRVSISGYPPLTSQSVNDATILAPAVSNIWTTSSTTWQTGAEAGFPLQGFNSFPVVWIIIEGKIKSECRGLAQLIERERVQL